MGNALKKRGPFSRFFCGRTEGGNRMLTFIYEVFVFSITNLIFDSFDKIKRKKK